jgi:beta-galactosidase/beta-glucuronidase
MKFKEMIGALQLGKLADKIADRCSDTHNSLMTVWGEKLVGDGEEQVLTEYPRPQMVRKNYTILNGMWKYAFTKDTQMPSKWDGSIRVPFSPETYMSGVERQLQPNEYLWYERELAIDNIDTGKRLLLNFGACDERCKVYINGAQAGKHAGGYQSFSIDITQYIKTGNNKIQVCVQDKSDTSYHGRGKQMLKNGGMFYTAQSGIWQTVWCEWVPDIYISRLMITPDYDNDSVKVSVIPNKPALDNNVPYKIIVFEEGRFLTQEIADENYAVLSGGKVELNVHIKDKKSWSPNSPFLYDIRIVYGDDLVESYFGMRHFSVEKDTDGMLRLCLNHVPLFQNGILDQGYYPESLLTPISDEAMINDIETAKSKGFNMIRKHCKIEPMRWYYHCDRLGMLVWQDMINGGEHYNLLKTCYIPTVIQPLRNKKDNDYKYMARSDKKGRLEWKRECVETIEQLYNCTSIYTWVLFNEGWGQFDAKDNTDMVRAIDDTRIIDAHSGWFDQNAGDVKSEHIYFFDLAVKRGEKPYVLSEYGGISLAVEGHVYSDNHFGYGKHENKDHFIKDYRAICKRIEEMKREGLCAAVYTQLTDIEEEINGIMTYDRKAIKI